MPGRVLIYRRVVTGLLISALALLVACGGANKPIQRFELSQYDNLADSSIQEYLNSGLGENEVVLVESKGDEFCILKERFQRNKRKIEDTDYAGF